MAGGPHKMIQVNPGVLLVSALHTGADVLGCIGK